jgi:hypothetical protein
MHSPKKTHSGISAERFGPLGVEKPPGIAATAPRRRTHIREASQ